MSDRVNELGINIKQDYINQVRNYVNNLDIQVYKDRMYGLGLEISNFEIEAPKHLQKIGVCDIMAEYKLLEDKIRITKLHITTDFLHGSICKGVLYVVSKEENYITKRILERILSYNNILLKTDITYINGLDENSELVLTLNRDFSYYSIFDFNLKRLKNITKIKTLTLKTNFSNVYYLGTDIHNRNALLKILKSVQYIYADSYLLQIDLVFEKLAHISQTVLTIINIVEELSKLVTYQLQIEIILGSESHKEEAQQTLDVCKARLHKNMTIILK